MTLDTKTPPNMTLQLRKAERRKAKLRIGLGGASGSGKTYSALLLANGLAPWNKIAVIDTENGSAELYSHLGDYNVVTITDDYAPERYIEAVKACEAAGMEVIIIDSITHEWDGKGGCLELVEKITQASTSKNSYTSWAKITPRHQAFIDSILQSKAHIITTVRKKQDYDMSKDDRGKTVITKVGMKEVTRDGFEYELTLSFNLAQNNLATVSKDRTNLFMNQPEFIISQETGKKLREWSESGAEPIPSTSTQSLPPNQPVQKTFTPQTARPTTPTKKTCPNCKTEHTGQYPTCYDCYMMKRNGITPKTPEPTPNDDTPPFP
jgi:hypothetical protein